MASKPIGGFFELELPAGGASYHPAALALCTGRACLGVALDALRPRRVHVPYYTCDALIEPIAQRRIAYSYYSLNERLEPAEPPAPSTSELFVYINYFGIKRRHARELRERLAASLLIDNTHDFFHQGYEDIWSFTSARKYFGVPDGAYLYAPAPLDLDAPRFTAISIEHNVQRLLGNVETGYRQYVEYEKSLDSSIHRISTLSEHLLAQVPYDAVRRRRRKNFELLHRELGAHNTLAVDFDEDLDPFCYPLLAKSPLPKSELHARGFFIPTLWPDTLNRDVTGFELERRLSAELLPLPIDHRYTSDDLTSLITFLERSLAAT